ncbi:MAG: flagellar basal body-associated FliL family protein [Bdellovibrionota bacterium]|nr:flagellar basal body-associated FliL family protein [Bdellovibrionota bacterium]
MAEEEAAEGGGGAPAASGGGGNSKPTLFIILAIINMLIVGGVGAMLYMGKKKEEAKPGIDNVIEGEQETQAKEAAEEEEFIGKLVPLETFLVNLAGTRGGKLMKINMSLEVGNDEVQAEIEKRKPQIRDIILILLSSKTYDQVSNREGKDILRDEIKNTVNSFLTKGQVKRVLFTEFFYN